MAKCECCGLEMRSAKGCTYALVEYRGKKYRRKKAGDEGWMKPGDRCGDCGALYGFFIILAVTLSVAQSVVTSFFPAAAISRCITDRERDTRKQ